MDFFIVFLDRDHFVGAQAGISFESARVSRFGSQRMIVLPAKGIRAEVSTQPKLNSSTPNALPPTPNECVSFFGGFRVCCVRVFFQELAV